LIIFNHLISESLQSRYKRKTNSVLTVNATVGSVGPPAETGGAIDLDMFNDQTVNIKALVVSIGFCVLEQLEQEFRGLLGPSALSGAPLLSLCAPANATVEPAEGNALLLSSHVLQEAECAPQGHLLDGLSRFSGVLQIHVTINIKTSKMSQG
jgi:hypothetical protein